MKYNQHVLQTSIKKAKIVLLVTAVCLRVAGNFSFSSILGTSFHEVYLLEHQEISSVSVLAEEKYMESTIV